MSEIVDCIAWIVEKTCWSFYVFCKFIALRILDLLGLFCNVLACLTIIRLPCMIKQFSIMESMAEWRYVGFIQCMIFLMDIPFILMALTVMVLSLGIVLLPMIKEIEEKDIKWDYTHKDSGIYFGGFGLRKLVANYFFKHVSGLLCMPLLLFTLLSWRSVIMVRELREHNYFTWKWRKVIVLQFLQLFLDIPCVFVAAIVVITWRLPFYIHDVKKLREDHGWSRWRFSAFNHFLLLFVDLFCFLLFIITMFTWRFPLLITELRGSSTLASSKDQWEARTIVVNQFLLIFVDIPCILCFLVVLITVWRLPRFVKNLTKNEWEIRANCVYQAAMMLVDFACFLIFGIVLLTLWRLYPLIRDIRKYKKRYEDSNYRDTDVPETTQEQSQRELKVVSRNHSWKIRKAICKHFIFLLIDIPAIIITTFVFVTMFRLPSLVSKLIQTGDFYVEFAMIVYVEVGKLLVDIVFLFIFLLLMILRPVASWVHLLEDDEHMQYRHICFHIKWIPDMIKETREKMVMALNEEFSVCVKDRVPFLHARVRMSQVCEPYLNQWSRLHGKVLKHDAYPDLAHLIETVMWHEGRRPYKMSRIYACELSYLSKPVPRVHNKNLSKFQLEITEYKGKLTTAYNELEHFTPPKVPLWSNTCALFTRSRGETQKKLLHLPGGHIFHFILILINLLLIYRGPRLLLDLYHRWYDCRSIIFRSLKEYLLDGLTFLRILIVLVFIYRAPALILDIAFDLFQKHSWTAVRATAKRYPFMIIEDIAGIIYKIFTWRSVRFLFTAVLFGILIPADVLLTVFKLSFDKCSAYLLSGTLYLVFMGFPFAFAFYFGEVLLNEGLGISISYIIGGYGFAIVIVLLGLIYILLRNRGAKFSVAPEPYDYVRLNWENVHVVVFETVEVLQLIALVFSLDGIPMAGSGALKIFSDYLLFNFVEFEVKLSLTVAGFLVWFIVCGAPTILENILKEFEEGSCASNGGWRLFMALFSNTLFLSIIEGLCGLVACKYPDMNCTNNGTLTNITCYTSSLLDDSATKCWVGKHQGIALFGLWGVFWYTTTSIIYGTEYGEVDSPDVDIKFSPVYNTLINFLKALMIGAVVLISAKLYVVLCLLLVLSVIAVIFTIFFKQMFGYVSCNSVVMNYFRIASFVILVFTVVTGIVAKKLEDSESFVPLIVFLTSSFTTLFVAFIASLFRKRLTPTEKKRRQFREYILLFEKRLTKEKLMLSSWKKKRSQWQRLVRHVYQAQKYDRNVSPEVWQGIEMSATTTNDYTAPPGAPPPDAPPPDFAGQHSNPPSHPGQNIPTTTPMQAPHPDYVSLRSEGETSLTRGENATTEDVTLIPVRYEGTYDLSEFLDSGARNIVQNDDEDDGEGIEKAGTMRHMKCNGKNILLFLERFIHYRAFSFSFVAQIPLWRQAVSGSNWTGLLHCLQVLDKALTGKYNNPTVLDISLGSEQILPGTLGADRDHGMPPSFTPEPRDAESIKRISEDERERALHDIHRLCPEEPTWLTVFEKVLPTIPVIRKWNLDEHSHEFELVLRRSCKATVIDVGPKGIKLAKGAVIVLPKRLKGVLFDNRLAFEKRFEPVGMKGPVSVAVSEAAIIRTSEKLYLSSNGKRISVEKAIDSLKSIQWS